MFLRKIRNEQPAGNASSYIEGDDYTAVGATAVSVTGDIQFDDFGSPLPPAGRSA